MEVGRLSADLKYVEINGVTINLEERSKLDLACMQLEANINQGTIYFWGKIQGKFATMNHTPMLNHCLVGYENSNHAFFRIGTTMDYFIVYTLTQQLYAQDPAEPVTACLPTKNFYWCTSQNFTFASLPAPVAQAKELIDLGCLFSGEFDTVLIESQEPPRVIDAAAGIILPPKHLTELDRLAATVCEIDRSCSAVPRGAMKYTPLNQVKRNEAFRGVARDQAFCLAGWVHFRDVENKKQLDMIAR